MEHLDLRATRTRAEQAVREALGHSVELERRSVSDLDAIWCAGLAADLVLAHVRSNAQRIAELAEENEPNHPQLLAIGEALHDNKMRLENLLHDKGRSVQEGHALADVLSDVGHVGSLLSDARNQRSWVEVRTFVPELLAHVERAEQEIRPV